MKIIYEDGSVLTCSEVEFHTDYVIADYVYIVQIIDIEKIVEED